MTQPSFRKVRARAPLRLGLAGGGTDLSPYCDQYGGAVLNITIDRFAFASILPRDDGRIVFEADDADLREEFDADQSMADARLILHRGVYERMVRDFNGGQRIPMTIRTTVDAPPGSGLGSSSALVVALVHAMRVAFAAPLGDYDVAHLAFEIERIDLGLSGGRQDHYAAAFGGINYLEFLPSDRVIVNPLRVPDAICNELESSIIVCFTGKSRSSAAIIDLQTDGLKAQDSTTIEAMHQLKSDATEMKRRLLVGDIEGMGEILSSSWKAKQRTANGISTERINELFDLAMANGAIAGKVSGAGGGGFMFFLVHPESRFRLLKVLNGAGAVSSPVKFTTRGCESWRF